MKVVADRAVCTASGQCVLAAPRVFAQSEADGVVVVVDDTPPEAELDAVRVAVRHCPTQALRLVES